MLVGQLNLKLSSPSRPFQSVRLARYGAIVLSQVRLASSVAARQFLVGLPSEEARQQFYPTLLPPLCLNRYYVAEGVRIYNQQTWKEVTHTAGKQLVEQHIQPVVSGDGKYEKICC